MHPGPEETFNESMYFNTYDPSSNIGVFVRIGNRPNEGHAEVTTCVYLPDDRIGFMFSRPKIDNNDSFKAGGAAFTCHEPFESLSVNYTGKLVMLDDPLQMADPREAFQNNPYEECVVSLDVAGASKPWGGEPVGVKEKAGEEFAKGHYEQLTKSTGTVKVGDQTIDVSGRGLRDHSWGPRTWQAPWYYRWLTVNMGDGTGMMLSRIARQDSDGSRNGFVWDGEEILPVTDMSITTKWTGEDRYQATVTATFSMIRPDGNVSERELTGHVLNLIPLRNRRDERVTRISEGLTRWELSAPLSERGKGDKGTAVNEASMLGYGWSEYLDQILDGEPVGISE